MKKSISIVALVVSAIVLAASCQCKCNKEEKPVAAKPVEVVSPKDQTDIFAIPLDDSEEEEQIEDKAIEEKVDESIAEKAKEAKAKEVKKTPEVKKDTPK